MNKFFESNDVHKNPLNASFFLTGAMELTETQKIENDTISFLNKFHATNISPLVFCPRFRLQENN
jgi:hypothetical protein